MLHNQCFKEGVCKVSGHTRVFMLHTGKNMHFIVKFALRVSCVVYKHATEMQT